MITGLTGVAFLRLVKKNHRQRRGVCARLFLTIDLPMSTTSSSGSKPSGMWQPPTLEEMQAMLPQYQFVSLLGRGGMGAVYKAVQVSLDRAVAVKVLPGDLIDDTDAQFAERFKNEARTMAKMNHPSIVNVYDFGETQTGLLFIVMEFIDGTDVAKMIVSQGKLPEDYALSITAHVCDALNYAHRNGVIHRDIKPANILINMDGAVKVADFGLAKQSDAGMSGLTKTNMAMGTPDFVAPEALIPGIPLDGRADLYAIGVMLYQMLTGEIPRGMWTMPGMKLGTDPRFDAIIGKAMQTDREVRYQSAAELRKDLDTILTTPRTMTQAQPVSASTQPAAHKPTAHGPRPPQQKVSASGAAVKADKPTTSAPKKSNIGLMAGIVGAVAVIGIGAFFASQKSAGPSGSKDASSNAKTSSSPLKDAFMQAVANAATPEQQVALVEQKLKELNGDVGEVKPTIVGGKVTGLGFQRGPGKAMKDFSPVAALRDLTRLGISYHYPSDLSFLRGMKIENLSIMRGSYTDVGPLRELPLKTLMIAESKVADWSVLRGKQLTDLQFIMAGVNDISFVVGMPLNTLRLERTQVTDLSPLRGLPLTNLFCDFVAARDTEILRSIKTLKTINSKPAAEFWASVGGGAPATTTPGTPALTGLPARTAIQTLDLLSLTDPVLDRVQAGSFSAKNEWTREDMALVYKSDGKAGKLVAPVGFIAATTSWSSVRSVCPGQTK